MRYKHLLAQHPLLSKLSGEVVWMVFEEEGVDVSRIDSFFEFFGRQLQESADLLHRLSDSEDPAAAYLRIERNPGLKPISDGLPLCAQCAALEGAIIPASSPDLMRWLPPYSLGCRLRGACISAEEAVAARIVSAEASPPAIRLVCESGWIYSADWSALQDGA